MAGTFPVAGKNYLIKYSDRSCNVTERKIRVISVARCGNYSMIRAWCLMRNDERSFRSDRIISCTELEECIKTPQPVRQSFVAEIDKSSRINSQKYDVQPLESPAKSENKPAAAAAGDSPSGVSGPCSGQKPAYCNYNREPVINVEKIIDFFYTALNRLIITGSFICFCLLIAETVSDYLNGPAGYNSYSVPASVTPGPVTPLPAIIYTPRTYMTYPEWYVPGRLPLSLYPGIIEEGPFDARNRRWRAISGITNPAMEKYFSGADRNGSGTLEIGEVETFQKRLYRNFSYIENETALSPESFFESGGGDCEDWAIFTCSMLQYWGIGSCVASFGPVSGTGHAVCLMYYGKTQPDDYSSLLIDGFEGVSGGYYIPVDYDRVGSLTDAVKDGWKLRMLFRHDKIQGWYM